MELNVKLTADELMNVVDAVMDEAIDRGYCEDDETVDDMLHIVDAALSAMGIEIVPADEDDEDEEEDNDPIADMLYILDDGRTAISFEDACFLMDMIKEVGMERGLSENEATEAAQKIFVQIGEDYGIDVVEQDKEEEEEKEEKPFNPITKLLVEQNGKLYLKESDAKVLLDILRELVYSKTEGLPDIIREKILCDMWCKIGEENRIEGVLRGE